MKTTKQGLELRLHKTKYFPGRNQLRHFMDVFLICLYIISVYCDIYHSKFHMQKVPFTIQFKSSVGISEKHFLHKPLMHALYLVAIILNISFYPTKSLQQDILSSSLAK